MVGKAQPLTKRSAPLIAIPTTAGTGAEVTRNAVLMVEDERVKVSLRSPLMLPAVALIDPTLTYTLPPAVTASTGLDALTQCIERCFPDYPAYEGKFESIVPHLTVAQGSETDLADVAKTVRMPSTPPREGRSGRSIRTISMGQTSLKRGTR